MVIPEIRKIKEMGSNKGQREIHESRVYRAEERFFGTKGLFGSKDITRNIVQNALMTLDEISAEEMQKEHLRHLEKENSIYSTIIWII